MRVAFRCDAGPAIGVGHLMRCVALAEELTGRGVDVIFDSDLGGLPWAESQLTRRGLARGAAEDADVVVLDSYTLPPDTAVRHRKAGRPVLAIVDGGDTRGQDADLYLDQNLGARAHDPRWLAGERYALLRDDVLRLRWTPPRRELPHVLCFFGGTDTKGLAPRMAEILSGLPVTATVVGAGRATGRVAVIPPTDRLPELMAEADLVITAAGSAIWELLYLGVPTALTWVAGNQLTGYRELVGRGLGHGLGEDLAQTVPLAIHERRPPGERPIDGRGRRRVADALLELSAQA
jgi:spore coat polysaccharide biosynthesis predicted glycosyltransferase SpsG